MRLAYRIAFYVIAVIVAIVLMSTYYSLKQDMSILELDIQEKLQYTAEMFELSVAEPLWDYNEDSLKAMGNALFKDDEVVAIVVQDNIVGEVFARNEQDPSEDMDNYVDISRIVKYEEKNIGTFRITLSQKNRKEAVLNRAISSLILLGVLIGILSIIIGVISRRITAPLELLEEDAKRLAMGEERIRISTYRDDEIGRLAEAFDLMANKIETTQSELKILNESLEDRVNLRTDELLEKNNELNSAIQRLNMTQEELMRASRLKLTTQLVYGVAHEINTPLGVTVTLNSYIAEKVDLAKKIINGPQVNRNSVLKINGEVAEATVSLGRNLERVAELVDHFKQLVIGDVNREKRTFNLYDLIEETVDNISKGLLKCNVIVELNIPKDLMIDSFPRAYMEIITHLMLNSAEHGFNNQDGGRVKIHCNLSVDTLHIEFSDDGSGIPEKNVESIFTAFFKDSEHSHGSGLGLAIVENIVTTNLMGHIECQSMLNQGTTFNIKVPL